MNRFIVKPNMSVKQIIELVSVEAHPVKCLGCVVYNDRDIILFYQANVFSEGVMVNVHTPDLNSDGELILAIGDVVTDDSGETTIGYVSI